MNQENIGRFIAEMRKECNMTQKQLAEKLGISDKTVSKWECGNGMPDLEKKKKRKSTDHYHFTSLFDFTNMVVFVILIAMTFCVLLGAGLHKYFLLGLKYSISKSLVDSQEDLIFAIQAFRLAEKALIYTGLFAGAFYMIVWSKAMDDPWVVGPYFRISVLNICYGMLGGLIMLLIRSKLQKKLSGTSL